MRKTLNSPSVRAGILLALASMSTPSAAGENSSLEELRALIEQQAAQMETMKGRLKELEQRLTAGDDAAGDVTSEAADRSPMPTAPEATPLPSSIAWKGAPEITSPDGAFTAKLRGRVLGDAWGTSSRMDDVQYPAGATLRAARLGIEGRLGPVFRYKFEGDFAGDDVTVKDAYLQYAGPSGWAITLGNQKPPFSLEHMTGLPRTTFMERALPNVFAISETLGASVATAGSGWTFALGVYGETPGTELDAPEGHSVVGRASFAPVYGEDRVLHLGVSGYDRNMSSASGAGFRIRQRPEIRVFGSRLVDTGANPADSATAMALEFAGTRGPFAVQGEYMRSDVDYRALPDATFGGAYLQASWFLTGENRPYDVKKAAFGRVKPNAPFDQGGRGAIELAARFSTLDLSDGLIEGGEEDNFTLGINWYPTAYARIAFNWVYFDVDGNAATMPYGQAAHSGHGFGARAQVDW
ncbi:MAG TPA: porin [Gammaproteobacteria bacterium]|nr:porin [Gammaproteobacteria bacterium]